MRSEADLVAGIRQRDPGIFEEFVRRYQQRVYFTALRMMGNRDDALDAAQEVFLKIWRFAGKTPVSLVLERWVYRITINTCIDRLRSRCREDKHTTHDNLILLNLATMNASPQEMARRVEQMERVKEALEELTERQRAIFVLRHFQNLKLQEIAYILEAPLGTVKATLHQTLIKLRGVLGVQGVNLADQAQEGS